MCILLCPKTFHSLRATAATFLHTAGVDHALAREIVGHDSETPHQLYIRPSDDQRKEAMEKFSEMIVPSACSEGLIEAEKRDLIALCAKRILQLDETGLDILKRTLLNIDILKS